MPAWPVWHLIGVSNGLVQQISTQCVRLQVSFSTGGHGDGHGGGGSSGHSHEEFYHCESRVDQTDYHIFHAWMTLVRNNLRLYTRLSSIFHLPCDSWFPPNICPVHASKPCCLIFAPYTHLNHEIHSSKYLGCQFIIRAWCHLSPSFRITYCAWHRPGLLQTCCKSIVAIHV